MAEGILALSNAVAALSGVAHAGKREDVFFFLSAEKTV